MFAISASLTILFSRSPTSEMSKSDILKKLNQNYKEKKVESSSVGSIEDLTSVREHILQKLEKSVEKMEKGNKHPKAVHYDSIIETEYKSDFDESSAKFEPQSALEKSPITPMHSDRANELNDLLELSNQHATEIHDLQMQLQKLQKKLSDSQPFIQVVNEHFGKISPQELNFQLRFAKEQQEQNDSIKDMLKNTEIQISGELQQLNVHRQLIDIKEQLSDLKDAKETAGDNDNFAKVLKQGLDKMVEMSISDSKRTIELTNQIVPQLAIQLKKQLTESIHTTKVTPLLNKLTLAQQELEQSQKSRDYYKSQVSKLTRVMTSSLMGSFDAPADYELLLQDIQLEVQQAFQNNDLPNDWLINWIEKTTPEQAAQSVSVMSDMLVELFNIPPPEMPFIANQDTTMKAPLFHLLRALLLKIYVLQTKKQKVVQPVSENELLEMVQKKIDVLQNSVNRKSNLLSHLNTKIET